MLEVLEFIFSSFWTWAGTVILIRSPFILLKERVLEATYRIEKKLKKHTDDA